MEASSSSNHSVHSQAGNGTPATPSHPSLLPALSPSSTLEQTPAPLHSLPHHLQHGLSVPRPSSANRPSHLSHTGHMAHGPPIPQPQFVIPGAAHVPLSPPPGMLAPGGGVFGVVMGSAPGQVPADQAAPGNAKVYASVYSGIPVYEAMIRGISVMRRTSDSWVNATQILKVAGIPKSTRTKILEKEVLTGVHEKVQGGYGKYQGTWIPLERGRDLAAQYGVDTFINCIFDFAPSSGDVAALPLQRDPSGGPKKTPSAAIGYTPGLTPTRVSSPYAQSMAQYPPENVILQSHPSALAYPSGIYYEGHASLAPPANIAALGLPPNNAPVYIDQYGRPHPTHHQELVQELVQNGDGQPLTKRARVEAQEDDEQVAEWVETNDDEPTAPLPASFRLSTKPIRPKQSATQQRVRNKLLSLFQTDEQFDLRKTLGLDVEEENTPEIDIDMVIDDLGHTALHWAAATAKPNVARQLIGLGADIHRGNYAGETPLIRAVLTNNLSEQGGYAEILTLLGPSIRTLDHSYRSVLHHIALVAGVKGRAACAREYMTGLLDLVAREGQPQVNGHGNQALKNLLDIQDSFGDTALNLAARVGNVPLIKLLLDSGADKARENKHGLKPVDYGLEVDALRLSPGEAVVASLKAEVPKPERYSRDVQKNIAAIFETINDTFSAEMTEVQTRLNATEQSVRLATKSLAEKRQQLLRAQTAIGDFEQAKQKVSNVKRSIEALSSSPAEWTSGRVTLLRESAAPPAFRPVDISGFVPSSEAVAVPQRGEPDALIRLRRMNAWEDRIDQVLRDRLAQVQSLEATTDKAVKYRRLIAAILKIPLAEVESCLPTLVQATRSDGSSVDAGRIGALLARFKEAGKQLQGSSRLVPSV